MTNFRRNTAAALVTTLLGAGALAGPASAVTSSQDTSFAVGGVFVDDAGATFRDAEATSDGGYLTGGTVGTSAGLYWRFERFDSLGQRVDTFGSHGVVMFKARNANSYLSGVEMSGTSFFAMGSDGAKGYVIAKFSPTGALDGSFGTRGQVQLTVDKRMLVSTADFEVGADGSMHVLGNLADPVSQLRVNSFVVRLGAKGRPDTSFSGDGIALVDVTKAAISQNLTQLAVDSSRRVVVAGSRIAAVGQEMVVTRLTPAGRFDTSFSGDGVAPLQPTRGAVSSYSAVNVLADGSVLLGGSSRTGVGASQRTAANIVKLTKTGRMDVRFSGDGLARVAESANATHVPTDLVRLPNGSMLMSTSPVGLVSRPALLIGLTSAGKLDTAFGSKGFQNVLFKAGGRSFINQMVPSTDGTSITAVGGTVVGAGTSTGAIARFNLA